MKPLLKLLRKGRLINNSINMIDYKGKAKIMINLFFLTSYVDAVTKSGQKRETNPVTAPTRLIIRRRQR